MNHSFVPAPTGERPPASVGPFERRGRGARMVTFMRAVHASEELKLGDKKKEDAREQATA